MIVKISPSMSGEVLKFDPETGDVFLRVKNASANSLVAWITTVDAQNLEDFRETPAKKGKFLVVNQRGGIRVGE